MDREFIQLHHILAREEAENALVTNPNWLIIRTDDEQSVLMPAIDLARHLQENEDTEIELMKIPASRLQLAPVDLRATLQEANNILNTESAEALFVQRMTAPAIYKTYGILTREKIEAAYKI
jgi:CIC family chloride channel protein